VLASSATRPSSLFCLPSGWAHRLAPGISTRDRRSPSQDFD
jgi:hypothetical protein